MKLNWFSPLPPDHTEIANVTARMMPSLARAFDLTVYTEREDWDNNLKTICPIRQCHPRLIDWKALHAGGIPVYHLGNNIEFHGNIMLTARKCPGIVVLHDLRLHETIMNLCLYKGTGQAGYFEILGKYGGPEAVAVGKRYLREHEPDMATISGMYPLFEYVLENALGVITYNPLNVDPIRKATPAPVLYAPLPFLERDALHPVIERRPKTAEKFKILIFGFLGSPIRRLRPFLEAFATSSARPAYEIILAGKYPENDVGEWIRDLGIEEAVTLRGFLPDDELDQLLRESDLTINLRWPSMGESSATLLRVWNFSLPAMVTDTAFYSTLPRDAVVFVDPEKEHEDIQRHLESFARNPGPYYARGLKGRALLESQHSIEASIEHLENFIPEIPAWRGNTHVQMFGRKLARDYLSEYSCDEIRSRLVQRCAEELATWS